MHHWLKSYCGFAECLDFAFWYRCIGKGLRLQSAQKVCFKKITIIIYTPAHVFPYQAGQSVNLDFFRNPKFFEALRELSRSFLGGPGLVQSLGCPEISAKIRIC